MVSCESVDKMSKVIVEIELTFVDRSVGKKVYENLTNRQRENIYTHNWMETNWK